MNRRQMLFSVLAGLAAPMALLCGATAWPAVLLGLSAAALGIQLTSGCTGLPRRLRGVYLLWAVLLMGKTANLSQTCFQDGSGVIPVVLLALAAAASRKPENCGRLGALLCPAVVALIAGMLTFAVVDFKWTRFSVSRDNGVEWMPITAMALSPLVLRFRDVEERSLRQGVLSACVFGMIVSVVCSGVLGSLQAVLRQPLYDMVRGVSVLGVAERLEAMVSVALCIGFFLTLCILCTTSVELVCETGKKKGEEWWLAVSALAVSRPVALLPSYMWFGFSCILGVVVPILANKKTNEKNREISKNNA